MSYSFSSKKKYFWVIENWQKKKTNMSGIKGVDKKKCPVENDKKMGFFYEKCLFE